MTDSQEIFDITILGGGPTGLFALFYAGMRQMKAKLIDALPKLGGQLTALYPEKYVYDMPGFKAVIASDLANEMIKQATQFNYPVHLDERAQKLEKLDDGVFKLTTDKAEHYSKTVLIAAGVGAFQPRKLNLPEIPKFENKGIYYTVPSMSMFEGKKVLVVGGGDSAVDWALALEPIAAKVDLIHRRDKFRAHEGSVQQMMNSKVSVHLFHELAQVLGKEHVEGAVIFHNKTGEKKHLEVDAIILALGFTTDLGPIKSWGLEMEGSDIKVNQYMQTNIPGVFAAGDVVTYPGKIKLIATGVAEAAMAINHAKTFIDPTAKAQPVYSTISGVPTTG